MIPTYQRILIRLALLTALVLSALVVDGWRS